MHTQTATLIGVTGLIGSHIHDLLEGDMHFTEIRLLVRRPLEMHLLKTKVTVVDFSDYNAVRNAIEGSHAVFCAVGTTQKKVKGDKKAYRAVDHDIPLTAARACAETGARHFLLVSSVGANSQSRNFYLRLKGEVEEAVGAMNIPSVSVFRPSMLLGKRREFRLGERIGQAVMRSVSFLLPSKYKPVTAADVAAAMTEVARKEKPGFHIYHYKEMRAFAEA